MRMLIICLDKETLGSWKESFEVKDYCIIHCMIHWRRRNREIIMHHYQG